MRLITPARLGASHNVACGGAGRRRFTLVAPVQVATLFIGARDHPPAAMPMPLADFAKPDFERVHRFREALAHARLAERLKT